MRGFNHMETFGRSFLAIGVVLVVVTGQVQVRHEKEPEFLAPLENLTVIQGRDIYFTCVVNHLQMYKVAWIKSDTKTVLAIHTHMVALNPRLAVSHNGHDTWKLYISNVQANDSGIYMCQVNTDPMRSQMGYLSVVIPPDIVDERNSPSEGYSAPEGGSVRLHCRATGVPAPSVTWRREGGRSIILRDRTGSEVDVLTSFLGESLMLEHVQRSDMGAYHCIASNGIPPTVSKRFDVKVLFHPLIRVPAQVVSAPVETEVSLQCYVEASPKAMNSWFRDSGEELLQSAKYDMVEVSLNEYALLMNMTIRNLTKRDFGGYSCASANALGKVEGAVRLQEIILPPKTTTTTTTSTTTERPTTERPTTAKSRKKQTGKQQGKQQDKKITNHILPPIVDEDIVGQKKLDGSEHLVNPSNTEKEKIIRPTSKPQWRMHSKGNQNMLFGIFFYIVSYVFISFF